jgi:hypothetical protein
MTFEDAGKQLKRLIENDIVGEGNRAIAEAEKVTMDMPIFPGPGFTFSTRNLSRNTQAARTKLDELDKAHEAVIVEIATELNADLKAMLKASWGWTSGARDIVETGALMRSGGATATGDSIEIGYAADYAQLVHNGGYVQPYGNVNVSAVYIPGRPWIAAVLGEANGPESPYPFQERYSEKMRSKTGYR